MLVSLVVDLASDTGRMVFSSDAALLPFGLFDADDDGRCLAWSCMLCIEFWRALDAAGRLLTGGGGEIRLVDFASAKVPCTGEDAGFDVFATLDAAVLGGRR